jgi:3-carboxy-cis,cis-muconate cycloisomerase
VFEGIFVPDDVREAVSDRAWLQALLDAERALALAEARAGVIPAAAADAIAGACVAERFDAGALAEAGRSAGNPVEPMVRRLTEAVGGDAARFVHWGATSQDVIDTAAMLVARDTVRLLVRRLDELAAACARLAEAHRETPIAARTLLQQAVPTTFGAKAAGWLAGVLDARRDLAALEFPAQLGGAAGTLAPLGADGPRVVELFAQELELAAPTIPWHTLRAPIARLAAALELAAGAAAKVALDVALLAQNEIGEVREGSGGASSTMPHKRNPVGSTVALGCSRLAHANASVLLGGLAQEHERAIGAWHAEWPALTAALAYTGGAVASVASVVNTLEVDAEAMRRNLDQSDGAVFAERVSFLLAEPLGRREAHELVSHAASSGRPLADELAREGVELPEDAFDVTAALGSATTFVDRVLERYRAEVGA